MKTFHLRPLALGLASLGAFLAPISSVHAGSGPTAICNPQPYFPVSVSMRYAVATDDPRIERMIAASRDPAFDPSLSERMGRPAGATVMDLNGYVLSLYYPVIQDPEELGARLRADAGIAALFGTIGANGVACEGNPTPAPTLGIHEYYNSSLNHFYMSSSEAEMNWLDAGGGGGGWIRTGHSWTTHVDSAANCSLPRYAPVYLFYGTPGIGPNSHYFTANPEECGYLRNTIGWTYLAVPFGAVRPVNGGCTSDAPVGLSLLYNNRAAQNDSNHRYTSNPQVYADMLAQGWRGYGVSLCVKSVGAPAP